MDSTNSAGKRGRPWRSSGCGANGNMRFQCEVPDLEKFLS